MPRSKKSASRGKARGGARGGSQGARGGSRDISFIPFQGTANSPSNHGYTLQEEARNTERHHVSEDPQQRLRYSRVNFVSASDPEPSEPQEAESALAELSLESLPRDILRIQVEVDETPGSREEPESVQNPCTIDPAKDREANLFFVDITGDETVNTGIDIPHIRDSSPTPSNSSEEVILFAGRDQSRRGITREISSSRPLAASIDAKIKIVEDQIHQRRELLGETLHHAPPRSSVTATSELPNPSSEFEAILPKRAGRKSRRARRDGGNAIDEELIADYIANMEEDDDNFTLTALNQRDLGATDSEFWQDESDTPDETCFKRPLDGWERSDICDFDDMSTSDGILGSVQAILSKRERESGIQYLVVWEDQAVDEARWVPQTSLLVAGATSHIDMFEAEEKLVAELMDDNDGDSENSEDSSASDSKMEEDERDNEDLLQRKIDRMADEQIARLLAKQEQLGMGSDELLLFDDDAEPDEDEDIYVPKSKPRQRASAKSAQRTEGKGAKRPRGGFPAAAALADAYDGFDVMDFERPSLKKKSKGRKGRLILDDVSDSELEESMQMAWENDRIKKKERKQEREELRSQGLLGKKGKVDMKGKYKEGMGVYAVKEEIKSFLMGHNESLSLPPMDKANRKIIHEIANAFKLKSKSVGNGNKRFPVLIRTTKTSIYVERTFAEVEAKLSRRFMPRMDARRSGGPSKRGGAGGGFGSTAVSYRDGDVVGGSAPELGVENKGRAMLEKMGWSSGTALGALNNKGILQPVSHIVKTSKAGLG